MFEGYGDFLGPLSGRVTIFIVDQCYDVIILQGSIVQMRYRAYLCKGIYK